MKRRPVPVTGLEDGESWAFEVCVVDRIAGQDAADDAAAKLVRRVEREHAKIRTSEAWVTRHYAAQGRRRYADLVDACGCELSAAIDVALANPRSMLLIGWCVVRPEPTA